jgi:hypothetical protein
MERCRECGAELRGRSDKQFCSDMCRNAYHNKKKEKLDTIVLDINHILLGNYKIIKTLILKGENRITIDAAIKMGFNFTYFTSVEMSVDREPHFLCYDIGYSFNSDNSISIIP